MPRFQTLVDHSQVMHRIGHDGRVLAVLIDIYVEDAPLLLQELRGTLQAGEAHRTREVLHKLVGLAGNFCSSAILEFLQQCEREAAEGRCERLRLEWNDVELLVSDLRDQLIAWRQTVTLVE